MYMFFIYAFFITTRNIFFFFKYKGGITNGERIEMRIAFKPTSTIRKPQQTVTRSGQDTIIEGSIKKKKNKKKLSIIII
jgi:hypothetical protein